MDDNRNINSGGIIFEGAGNAVSRGVLSVVMPVFNEVATVEEVLRTVLAQPVVAVDDGSRDGTAEVLERVAAGDSRVKVLRHGENRGKGEAVIGSRFIGSQEHRVLYFWHSIGNRVLIPKSPRSWIFRDCLCRSGVSPDI